METKKILASKNVILASVIAAVLLVAMVGSASAALCSNAIGGPGSCYCGDTVNGDYTFNANMNCVAGQHGLIIGANDIVIDGQGHKITGAEDADNCSLAGESTPNEVPCGVLIHGKYNNVTVENLEVENFCTGVAIKGQNKLNPATDITISECAIHDNGNVSAAEGASTHGIHMVWTSNSDITKNEIYNNTGTGTGGCSDGGCGIFYYAEGTNNNNITCNNIHGNRKAGFFMKKSPHHNRILYNNVSKNGGPTGDKPGGIILRCKKTNFNTIAYNNVSDNTGDGINVGGRNNTVKYNTVVSNTWVGISVDRVEGGTSNAEGSENNTVFDNTACNNGIHDTTVVNEGGNICYNNTCGDCYCDGAGCANCCPNGAGGACTYTCDSLTTIYYDYDGDGDCCSDNPADWTCNNTLGVGACNNPGKFNSSGWYDHCYLECNTTGNDFNDCDASRKGDPPVAPVPELATIVLFGAGLITLVGYVELRKRRKG